MASLKISPTTSAFALSSYLAYPKLAADLYESDWDEASRPGACNSSTRSDTGAVSETRPPLVRYLVGDFCRRRAQPHREKPAKSEK